MVCLIRYVDDEDLVRCELIELQDLNATESSAEQFFKTFCDVLNGHKISINYIIALSTSCIKQYFSLQTNAKPEIIHCLRTSEITLVVNMM